MSNDGLKRGSLLASAALAGLVLLTPGDGNSAEGPRADMRSPEPTEIVFSAEDQGMESDTVKNVMYVDPTEITEEQAMDLQQKLADPEIVPSDPQQQPVVQKEYVPYLDLRNARTQDGQPIGVLGMELLATRESDRLDGIVVLSFTNDDRTQMYYEIAQEFLEEGAPIAGFIRGPEDGENGFVVYADGEAITLDGGKLFNNGQQLAQVIEFGLNRAATRVNASYETGSTDGRSSAGEAEIAANLTGMDPG